MGGVHRRITRRREHPEAGAVTRRNSLHWRDDARWSKYIEKDRSLRRRFQAIKVDPPAEKETIETWMGVGDRYEQFHHVETRRGARGGGVSVEPLHHHRFLPDKAIDLVDELALAPSWRSGPASSADRTRASALPSRWRTRSRRRTSSGHSTASKSQLARTCSSSQFEVKSSARRIVVSKSDIDEVVSSGQGADRVHQSGRERQAAADGK